MKILLINTFDEAGGAARSAARLQNGLLPHVDDINTLVQFKTGNDSRVICKQASLRKLARRLKLYLGLLPVKRYANRPENNFSPALVPDRMPSEIHQINPDIIHLHWLCAGFLSVETIGKLGRLGKPLVWTLHDSWPFTGGCHVPFDCTRYRQNCGACPVLGSSRAEDLSRKTWERKWSAWRNVDITLVAPSLWLAECARSSSLFQSSRIDVIPNGLDTKIFRPVDKRSARRSLGLPVDKNIILFGAVGGTADLNKGFQFLVPALRLLGKRVSSAMAVIFGADKSERLPDLGMPVVSLGRIRDDRQLALVYAAADVFAAPSMLENLPNTVMETMACATPCVAFRQGGVTDLIDHEMSGYLAQPYEIESFANGLAWVLEDDERRVRLADQAQHKIKERFSLELMSHRYAELYRELLQERLDGPHV